MILGQVLLGTIEDGRRGTLISTGGCFGVGLLQTDPPLVTQVVFQQPYEPGFLIGQLRGGQISNFWTEGADVELKWVIS